MNIEWFTKDDKINTIIIDKVQDLLGIKLPDDYLNCIKENNGGHPTPGVYDFKNHKEAVFEKLLSFSENNKTYIVKIYNKFKENNNNIIPFAYDSFGNFICFDYREGKDRLPKIVFWDHEADEGSYEKSIYYICDSFTELLEKLYDPDEG